MMARLLEALRRPSITAQPPTAAEHRRNDILMVVAVIVAVLLGLGLRALATGAGQEFALGGRLPSVRFPASWLMDPGAPGLLLRALDLESASTFDARLEVYARDVREGETLESIATSWPLGRSRQLEKYRILRSEVVGQGGSRPALLITYAYVADPTRESGAAGLPVVVKAQDLVFVANDGAVDRLVAVTVAADATEWAAHAGDFQGILDHLLSTLADRGASATGNSQGGGR